MEKVGYGLIGGCVTDLMLHSSKSYHHGHGLSTTMELRRQHKEVPAVRGAVISRFHGDCNM